MKRVIACLISALLLAATVLEALPYGAVLRFATEDGALIRTYSYFSFVPFGYANFAPLITAFFTVVALAVSVICIFNPSVKVSTGLSVLLFCATAISFAPLTHGRLYFGAFAISISLLLALALVLSAVSFIFKEKTKR